MPSPFATQAVACLTLGRTALPVANVIPVTMAATRLTLKLDCLSSDDVKRWSPPHHPAVVATTAPQRTGVSSEGERVVERKGVGMYVVLLHAWCPPLPAVHARHVREEVTSSKGTAAQQPGPLFRQQQ